MTTAVPRGVFALVGFAAGALVGFVDGLWSGVAAGAGPAAALLSAVLAASVGALVALGAGAAIEVVVRFAAWGRAVRVRPWAEVLVAVLMGAASGAATAAVIYLTLARRNRFLAGGEVALAGATCAVLGAAIAPGLARLVRPARGGERLRRRSWASVVVLWPAVASVVGGVVLWGTMSVVAPATSGPALGRVVVAALEMALLPGLLTLAERIPLPLRGWKLVAPAAVVAAGGAAVFVASTWAEHLRFLPWVHVVPAGVMVGGAVGLVVLAVRRGWIRLAARGRFAAGAVGALVAVGAGLAASESESARKLTATRVAFVGPVLAGARQALDRDKDGFSPLFGGGDCDDGDADRHPGGMDIPDDGMDQDCDGADASFAALAPGPFAAVPESVPRDLNLLLVTVDTVRADHLGCYGYPRATSPELDALAGAGALFVNGWAHAPSTRYSMPAIATGRWPSAITWDESIWWPRIATGVPTLAQALKSAGYLTAAFYSFEYFSPSDRRGFERGVDQYRADRAALHQAVNGPMESRGSSSREMANDTIAFLEAHGGDKFFLWVHFYDPHLSYEPHPEVPSFGTSRIDRYDGEIRFTDLHLGRVFRRLRELGLWERTAVFVTGDHGEGFGEHGVTEHGFDLYAPQTRVPLLVRVPGLAPQRILTPAGHVDLAPTMLNLARAPQNPSFLGRSLVAELAGDAKAPEAPARAVFQEVSSERGKKRALVTADTHLIWNWTPENTTECYDLRADPGERRDLWGGDGDAACRALKTRLQGMVSVLSLPPDVGQKMRASVFNQAAGAPRPAVATDVRIGEVLRIVGYDVTPAAAAGGDAAVTIHFDCLRALPAGWRFFFHLVGPGGFRNLDHIPVDGAMPPERWRPGQRILDRLRVPFPAGSPPGSYALLVGLYRGGERLEVTPAASSDGNRAVRVLTIQRP